jgi:Asp-tRNA(Asn)/Glu-tRNA(Gln) amidotransferase A subunit family amidase
MTDLMFTPAYQLAQMIRDHKVSAVEVLEAHLAQINKHNSMLNAIYTLDNVIRIVVHNFNSDAKNHLQPPIFKNLLPFQLYF